MGALLSRALAQSRGVGSSPSGNLGVVPMEAPVGTTPRTPRAAILRCVVCGGDLPASRCYWWNGNSHHDVLAPVPDALGAD